MFVALPAIPVKLLEQGFRSEVLTLVAEHAIGERLSASMLAGRHSDFSVHNGVRVRAGDAEGRKKRAQYMLRAPLSLEKMTRIGWDAAPVIVGEAAPVAWTTAGSGVTYRIGEIQKEAL